MERRKTPSTWVGPPRRKTTLPKLITPTSQETISPLAGVRTMLPRCPATASILTRWTPTNLRPWSTLIKLRIKAPAMLKSNENSTSNVNKGVITSWAGRSPKRNKSLSKATSLCFKTTPTLPNMPSNLMITHMTINNQICLIKTTKITNPNSTGNTKPLLINRINLIMTLIIMTIIMPPLIPLRIRKMSYKFPLNNMPSTSVNKTSTNSKSNSLNTEVSLKKHNKMVLLTTKWMIRNIYGWRLPMNNSWEKKRSLESSKRPRINMLSRSKLLNRARTTNHRLLTKTNLPINNNLLTKTSPPINNKCISNSSKMDLATCIKNLSKRSPKWLNYPISNSQERTMGTPWERIMTFSTGPNNIISLRLKEFRKLNNAVGYFSGTMKIRIDPLIKICTKNDFVFYLQMISFKFIKFNIFIQIKLKSLK